MKDELNEIMIMLIDAHTLLSKTSLSQNEYQPISTNLNLVKLKITALINKLTEI
jgi:hypothetical protein